MAGARLFHRREKNRPDRRKPARPSFMEKVRGSRFLNYFVAFTIGSGIMTSGTNIKHFGGNPVMAQPGKHRVGADEKEDVAYVQQKAVDAATAFRNYIIGGDSAQYDLFWKTYNGTFKETPMYENKVFMDRLEDEMDKVKKDKQVAEFLKAYDEDRKFAEPVVMVDFINAMYRIRTALVITPPEKKAAMTEDLVLKEGEKLTKLVMRTMPDEQARMAVDHLREFILTGNAESRNAFTRIWNANTSTEFTDVFSKYFAERIYGDKESGLADITQAYNKIMKGIGLEGIDPTEFATLVIQTYNLAMSGTREDVDNQTKRFLKQLLGKDAGEETVKKMNMQVINPLLKVVSKGLAERSIKLMREVMATGDQRASTEFATILNGTFLGKPIEENDDFWNVFQEHYIAEIKGNTTLKAIVRGFKRNVVPIAIRDIYTELAREKPDMERLHLDYGPKLVELISSGRADLRWFIRNGTDLDKQIKRRVGLEDALAIELDEMKMKNKGAALAETYYAVYDERSRRKSIEALDIIEENFEGLSWLAGTPEEVQRELDRRARTRRGQEPDALAVALRTRYPENAGQILSQAYGELTVVRERRKELNEKYGEDFVKFISQNLESLHWVVIPIEQIENGMSSRKGDVIVKKIGETMGADYSYSPVQLVASLARARQAINRGGVARLNASEALGTFFVRPVVSREAVTSPTISPDATKDMRAVLERRGKTIGRDIDNIEKQLEYSVLLPAKALLSERMRRWRQENARIRGLARTTYDKKSLDRLEEDQKKLMDSMLSPVELRRSVEMAFSMIHVAETGGDVTRMTQLPGIGEVDIDTRDLKELLRWYRSSEISGTGKGAVIEDIIASIMRQADPQLYEFIGSMNERGFFDALMRTYMVTEGIGADTRADVSRRYNEEFVGTVEDHAAHLTFLTSPASSITDLQEGENLLFAAIVTRCYRAIANPTADENRDKMVKLFGEEFVKAVEKNKEQLKGFAEPGAGIDQVKELPKETKSSLRNAYHSAYSMVRNVLMKEYLEQEGPLFYSLGAIYAVLRERPAKDASQRQRDRFKQRVRGLQYAHGKELVALVAKNMKSLRFLESPSAGIAELKNLSPELVDSMYTAFGKGPAAARTKFMDNFDHVATVLPRVYLRLTNALLFANPTDQLGINFEEAVSIYRQEFGDNNHLFNQYINLELFGNTLNRLAAHYNIPIPPYLKDKVARSPLEIGQGLKDRVERDVPSAKNIMAALFGEKKNYSADEYNKAGEALRDIYVELTSGVPNNKRLEKEYGKDAVNTAAANIKELEWLMMPQISPEELAQFLKSDAGRQLITGGRSFYDGMVTSTLQQREMTGFRPAEGEFTDERIKNLGNQLSIMDALYLGMSLERIGGADSSFRDVAANELMNTILVIAHRDPYLIGPYLLQVLPAIIEVSQDERTLVAGMATFRALFSRRYGEGQRNLAYSNALNRRYFLDVFRRIGEELPQITSTYDHNRIGDDLRLLHEPGIEEETVSSPLLYRYKPGWWQYQERELPMFYGQYGAPLSLRPQPTSPTSPFLPVPGGFTLDSGARGIFSKMYDQLRPPAERLFRRGIPARYRIGALGASTVTRRITQLFGPMPVNYQDYWLGLHAEAGGFYAAEGEEERILHQAADEATVEGKRETESATKGAAGLVVARSITGMERATAVYRGTKGQTTTDLEGEEMTTSSEKHRLDYSARAAGVPSPLTGPLPLPVLDLVPYDTFQRGEEIGIQTLREEFTYESELRVDDSKVPKKVKTREEFGGVYETYQRIAKENKTDMLVYVKGKLVPELKGRPTWDVSEENLTDLGVEDPSSIDIDQLNDLLDDMENDDLSKADRDAAKQQASEMLDGVGLTLDEVGDKTRSVEQEKRGALRSRLAFITQEGDIYQLAFGAHTESQLSNFLYAGANTQQWLASFRFMGKEMMTDDAAAAGFDGAAMGITIPRGKAKEAEGDTVSALAFGQLVKNLSTMDPVHAEEAAGAAVTNILADRRQRDVYAAFYRGAQITELDPEDKTKIANSRWAEGTGEVMWRRMAIKPMEHQMEARFVGGYPATAGARWRHEIPVSRYETAGYGALFSYTEVDLLREYRVIEQEADDLFANMKTYLVDVYGWDEDKARNTGWLIAANYLHGELSNWAGHLEEGEKAPSKPSEHYATVMMMYWVNRHGMLAGVGREPAYVNIYKKIERAMTQIQYDPTRETEVLTNLNKSLKDDLQRDIWSFALGYGYDGEKIRVYTIAGGRLDEERSYGNLYGLVLFGRPTKAFADILGHAYRYAPLVISEDSSGEFQVQHDSYTPWLDLYGGFGMVNWPAWEGMRYEREVTIPAKADLTHALKDAYVEVGSSSYNGQRIVHSYGEELAAIVSENSADLSWMVRPQAQIAGELKTRVEEDEDPVARLAVTQLFADRMSDLTDDDYKEAAQAIRDVYIELRKPAPDIKRLQKEHTMGLVDIVAKQSSDLSWILLPPDKIRNEFGRKAAIEGSVEDKIASRVSIPKAPTKSDLTGEEVRQIFAQNPEKVLIGFLNPDSRYGLESDRYDIMLGSYLREDKGRHDKFYVMLTPPAVRGEARGSIIVGNKDDYEEWRRHDRYIGRGVRRVDVSKEEGNYKFTFSGDKRQYWAAGEKIIGGITLPLDSSEYDRYRAKRNWTVGGLIHLLSDHQNDWLAGALYGLREYGARQWDQLTITTSLRHQLTNTATYSDQIFWYMFFNRITGRIVVSSKDVFAEGNEAELNDVCQQLGGCAVKDFGRTTGGTGITWARADVITGERVSLHFFFEGGAETRRVEGATLEGAEEGIDTGLAKWQDEFIFRTGFGVSWLRQPERSPYGTRYSLFLTADKGYWSAAPEGEVGRPEYLNSWMINSNVPMGFKVMLWGQIEW